MGFNPSLSPYPLHFDLKWLALITMPLHPIYGITTIYTIKWQIVNYTTLIINPTLFHFPSFLLLSRHNTLHSPLSSSCIKWSSALSIHHRLLSGYVDLLCMNDIAKRQFHDMHMIQWVAVMCCSRYIISDAMWSITVSMLHRDGLCCQAFTGSFDHSADASRDYGCGERTSLMVHRHRRTVRSKWLA